MGRPSPRIIWRSPPASMKPVIENRRVMPSTMIVAALLVDPRSRAPRLHPLTTRSAAPDRSAPRRATPALLSTDDELRTIMFPATDQPTLPVISTSGPSNQEAASKVAELPRIGIPPRAGNRDSD